MNDMSELYEKFLDNHYRFTIRGGKGHLTVEDLFSLSLQHPRSEVVTLDTLAKGLNRQLQDEAAGSFVTPDTAMSELLKEKLEIVKRVIRIKQDAERNASEWRGKVKELSELKDIYHGKQLEEKKGMSNEELAEKIDSLSKELSGN